jgi:hypothetical protein
MMSEVSNPSFPPIDEQTVKRVLAAYGTLGDWQRAAVAPHSRTPAHMINPHAAKKALAQILELVNSGNELPPRNTLVFRMSRSA